MDENLAKRKVFRLPGIGLPVALIAAVGGGAWLLTSQEEAEAASGNANGRNAATRKAPVSVNYDRIFENVYFKVPDGYRAIQQEGGVIMARASDIESGKIGGFIVISKGVTIGPTEREAVRKSGKALFVQAMAVGLGNLANDPDAKLSEAVLANNPAQDGYEGYLLVSRSHDADANKDMYTQYAVYLAGDRVEMAMRFGYGSEAQMEALGSGFDALLKSMEFKNMGAPAPARFAAALPNSLEALSPKDDSAPSAPRSSSQAQASRPSENGLSCKAEPRLLQRPGRPVYCPNGGCSQSPPVVSYYGAAYVCRKNGKIVSVRQ
jgi:hypothetical protein